MADYEPLDLTRWCNAGPELLGAGARPAVGRQSFRGLPFLIGDEGNSSARCFVALGKGSKSVTIPVGKAARRVIFAHTLLETKLHENGALGSPVAEYVFRLAGGVEERVLVRERFQIATLPGFPPGTPGLPFLAVPDGKATLMPRYEGSWGEAGRRQTEATQATASLYFLWPWVSPQPNKAIESIEIVPKGQRFLIGAITLGHADEHPFAREGRRPTKIVLKDAAAAGKPASASPSTGFDLDVEVDRGDATYGFALPAVSADEFIKGRYSWGQPQNDKSSPSYVEISAIPSATVTVKRGGQALGSVKWAEVTDKGVAETDKLRVELIDPGKNWVTVKVLDEETGKPVPCRVHFRSPEGVPYQPYGHHNYVNSNLGTWHNDVGGDLRLGQITYAYIDGTCQGWLPRGEVIVDVSRGFEYEPLRTRVSIAPGQRELTLRIKRWIDMNGRRWFSGDSHVHFLSPTGAHLEAQCEDLDIVNLLQSQWGSLFTNTEDFTGAVSRADNGQSLVYVCQENRQHFMGHMILWGLKKPVMPWCSDGLGEAEIGGSMETTLSYWADEAHAQGGWVVQPHFPNPNGEAAALIATGRLDGIEMIRQALFNHREYYRYLNCGYRLPLVGGTDKMSSDVPVGLYRTYVYVPEDEEFTYENWCRAVARGRTFLSGGPLIGLTVDGKDIGDTVKLSSAGTVGVHAWAESIFPVHRLEIVQEGGVVAVAESKAGARRLELRERLKIGGHTWLAARCGGPKYFDGPDHHDVWSRGVFAHTSPVYVACGGEWWMHSADTSQYMLTMVEGDLAYISATASLATPSRVTHRHGEADHLAFLQRPFLEAREAVLRRAKEAERRGRKDAR